MNERILTLAASHFPRDSEGNISATPEMITEFAESIMQDMHKKVIASILITDVVMEEKDQVPGSEDYIRAINNDFGVEL